MIDYSQYNEWALRHFGRRPTSNDLDPIIAQLEGIRANLARHAFDRYNRAVKQVLPGAFAKGNWKLIVIDEYYEIGIEPVGQFQHETGLTLTLSQERNGEWLVSVDSPKTITGDFEAFFDPQCKKWRLFSQHMPQQYWFGTFAENQRQFTVCLEWGFEGDQLLAFFRHIVQAYLGT